MTTDAIERLRLIAGVLEKNGYFVSACQITEAADEIERLRKEIEQLLKAHAAYEQAITKIEDEWHHE